MMMTATGTTGITDIADVLTRLGVTVKRIGEREISGCCPVHAARTGKEDRSPSWSINASTGLWICYSCGAKGTLSTLVSELTGEPDSIIAVHSFLVQSGLDRLTAEPTVAYKPEVDWKVFSAFPAPSDQSLWTRGLDRASAKKYGIRFDEKKQAWILPIVSSLGELLGWQEKEPAKVRNYPIGVKKSDTLFGLDKVSQKVVMVVESPLDVVRVDTVMDGVSAVATFGSHVSRNQIRLLSEHADSLIIAMDNDEAGIESAKRITQQLPSFRYGVKYIHYAHTDAKDIGEMTQDEILTAVKQASVLPWWINV